MEPLHRSGMAIKGRYSASKWSFVVSYGPFELFLGHFWGNWAPQWAFLTREMVPWHCLGVLWLVPTLFHQFGSTRLAHGHKMAFLAIWSHFEGLWRPNSDFWRVQCHLLWMLLWKKIFSTIFQARIWKILIFFLSETIHAQENGSRGTHFAKFLISNFLKSLTYSALVAIESSYLTSVCVSMCVCKLVTQVQV